MANTGRRQPKKTNLLSILVQLFQLIVSLALLGILVVIVGALLIVAALVGSVALLLLGSLVLALKGCSGLLFHMLRISTTGTAAVFAKATASKRYQHTIKPWLIIMLKQFVRWLVWKLWQWASSASASGAQPPFQSLASG